MNIIESKVQLHYRYFKFLLGGLLLFGILAYFSCTYDSQTQFSNFLIFFISFIVLMIVISIVIRRLTKRILFSFGESLLIQIFDLNTNDLKEQYEFNYNDIESYSLSSGSSKTCTIKFDFINRKSFRLILYSADAQFVKLENIDGFKIFQQLVNKNQEIKPAKPFLMTSFGNVAMILLLIMFVINVLIHLKFADSTAFLISLPTLLGVFLMIILTRKKQQIFYNKMKEGSKMAI